MPQSFACVYLHIVFSTKHRLPQIDKEFAPQLYSYMGGILRRHQCSLIRAGGMPGHVHLLVSLCRVEAIKGILQAVKGSSSLWVHQNFRERQAFAWQAGYGAFGVSYSQRESVIHYIDHQEEHHATQSFQDEFRALLRLHDLEWDERYVWD
jgi:putative transposase